MRSVARSTRMVVVALLAPVAAAYAGSVELTFKTLPSAPEWIYEAKGANTMSNDGPFEGKPSCDPQRSSFPIGNPIPWLPTTPSGHNLDEKQVFWVKGGQLYLDTVHPCFPTGTSPAEQPGCPTKKEGPFQWHGSDQGGDNVYRRYGEVSKAHPFSLLVSVQITNYLTAWDCSSGNPLRTSGFGCGFSVGASTGDEIYELCMTDKQVTIVNASGPTTLVKMNTGDRLHTYRLDVVPKVGALLFIDDETTPRALSSGPIKNLYPTQDPNGLFLGDGTGGANVRAAISKFVYRDCEPPARQGKVPE